jgi:uncharacterized protein involved in exopolysaccharide biosynthesis
VSTGPQGWVLVRIRRVRTGESWTQRAVGSGIIAAVAGMALYLAMTLLPTAYQSRATLLVRSSSPQTSGLAALAASQLGLSPSNFDPGSPQFILVALTTFSVMDSILDRPYVTSTGTYPSLGIFLAGDSASLRSNPYGAYQKLRRMFDLTADLRAPILKLEVTAGDSVGAADVARTTIDVLSKFVLVNRATNSRAQREFLDREVAQARAHLRSAEDSLQAFLAANHTIATSPLLTFRQNRLQREIDHATLLEATLTTQLQSAKVDEARDTPVITVIDPPKVPTGPYDHHRKLLAAMVAALAGLAALAWRPFREQFPS